MRALTVVAAVAVALGGGAWLLSGGPGRAFQSAGLPATGERSRSHGQDEKADGQVGKRDRRRDDEPGVGVDRAVSDAADVVGGVARAALTALILVAIGGMGIGGALTLTRALGRRSRVYRRFILKPYRVEDATPAEVCHFIEALQQMTLERWYRRLLLGQGGIVFEVSAIEVDGQVAIRFTIACPESDELREAIDGRLTACYGDSSLVDAYGEPSWLTEIVRLKRRYPGFWRSLRIPDRYDTTSVVDSAVAVMYGMGKPCTVQLAMVPTPALFDRIARWMFRREEQHFEKARVRRGGADPGTRSEVVEQELEASAAGIQNRPLFFGDIRIAAHDYETARRVAGAIRGDSSAQNRLVERRMRGIGHRFVGRRWLYQKRVAKAWPNPLPSWRKGVYSSAELAGLWHLPSPHLKGVRVERQGVPRVPAPPEIWRPGPDRGLLLDERGPVGIRPEDMPMNLMLLGGQGTGKTALMCRTVAADVCDPNCCVIVLDGKSDLAFKALSVIPPEILGERKVHFLDFAHPEIGVDLFAGDDWVQTADGVVEAFKAFVEEGGIRESSERYLFQSALAILAWAAKTGAEGGATLHDMWTLLMVAGDGFRQEVVRALETDPSLAATAMFFGEQLPDQLKSARSMMTTRLDAPVNKLMKVAAQPRLDTIMRHPVSVDIGEIIENRDILVISGAVGSFGEGSAIVLLQLILNMVHRALIRQQELPEKMRARVALKVDEAHLLFSKTYARMLAMDRSAGLECVSTWQSLAQIADRNLRAEILDLHRQRFCFSVGADDAKEMSYALEESYSSVIRDDRESRGRMRFPPDSLVHLPNFYCAASVISRGSRAPSFVGQTIPMADDAERIERHLEAQRERGARYPGVLPPPRRDYGHVAHADLDGEKHDPAPSRERARPRVKGRAAGGQKGSAGRSSPAREAEPGAKTKTPASGNGKVGGGAEAGGLRGGKPGGSRKAGAGRHASEGENAQKRIPDFDPQETSEDRSADRVGVAPLGSDVGNGVAAGFGELDMDGVTDLRWEQEVASPIRAERPRRDELETLVGLYELRFLLATQIARRFMPTLSTRSVQLRLAQMRKRGWVRRAQLASSGGGQMPRVYALAKGGYELVVEHAARVGLVRGASDEKWRDIEVSDPLLAVHDLHAAGWLFAFEALMQERVVEGWRGPRRSVLEPPRMRAGTHWRRMSAEDVPLGSRQRLTDLELEEFEPIKPDMTVELNLKLGDAARKVDLLIELDRTGRASSNYRKFQRYDALLNGWAMSLSRYKMLGEPPAVVFAVEDDEKAQQFLKAADRLMTGRVATLGEPEASWPHYGRKRLFVVAERDVHQGTLRALRLPEHPPRLRRELGGKDAGKPVTDQVASLFPNALMRRRGS